MIYKEVNKELLGKKIKTVCMKEDPDSILFVFEDNSFAIMCHEQECCEVVYIEDINGDLSELEGAVLYSFEEASNSDEDAFESATWTFYRIKSSKGYMDIRWYGKSNGYYSESVQVNYYFCIEHYFKKFYIEDNNTTTIDEFIDSYYKN